ncbi:MAG TPA: response regulator [candidate division Zixibacteria bacterium]|nr:response regulator [candidate division Zixibacteria bacterium]
MNSNKQPVQLLLVDDEEEFLLATSQALTRRGFNVTVAPNGVTALDKLAQQTFDVVVLDVKMPDIDGLEVFSQINNRFPSLPVIILTGHPSVNDAFDTSKQGIADYLAKPVEMEELAQKILKAVEKAAQNNVVEDKDDNAGGDAEGISVLLVDDETELLDSLQRLFRRRKMHCLTADNGPRALELLQEELVDVMVLDVKMPGMDGIEVLKQVKEKHPSIQVILLSGHPSVSAAMEGVKLGASEYLKKPPDIGQLVETIRRLYKQRQQFIEAQQRELIDEIRRRYTD